MASMHGTAQNVPIPDMISVDLATPEYIKNVMVFCANIDFDKLPLYITGVQLDDHLRMERLDITISDITLLVKWRLERGI